MSLFRIVSETGDGLGVAIRLQAEGHDVCMFIRDENANEIGDNMVMDKYGAVADLFSSVKPDSETVFIFDTSGNGAVADYAKHLGFPVVGGSLVADRLEHDRGYGFEVMKNHGIEFPETFEFDSWEEGIQFAKRSRKKKYVFKPSGRLSEISMSRVATDAEDLVELLRELQATTSDYQPEFVLQEFVDGVCVSTEGWFDGTSFIRGLWNHTLETKNLMNDNLGPAGGCTGNVVWACGVCPICLQVAKLEKFLKTTSYAGPIDLNCVVNEDGPKGLEWTPRFGYDATPTLLFGLLSDKVQLGDLMKGVASGGYKNDKVLRSGFAAGVKISLPPWPTEKFHAEKNVLIRGIRDEDNYYPYNVKADSSGQLRSAGAWGLLCVIIGRGSSIAGAFEEPYKITKRLKVPNVQYRTDLVEVFEKQFDQLVNYVGKGIAV